MVAPGFTTVVGTCRQCGREIRTLVPTEGTDNRNHAPVRCVECGQINQCRKTSE